jgi:hypothetical protein
MLMSRIKYDLKNDPDGKYTMAGNWEIHYGRQLCMEDRVVEKASGNSAWALLSWRARKVGAPA